MPICMFSFHNKLKKRGVGGNKCVLSSPMVTVDCGRCKDLIVGGREKETHMESVY